MGSFNKIYAFEPGNIQITALKTRLRRLVKEWNLDIKKIIITKAALSDKSGFTYFNDNNEMLSYSKSKNIINANKVKTIVLDEFVKNNKVGFIKADVEGMELELIKGAKKVIKNHKPLLAIAAYHYPNDIFNIYTLIRSIRSDYNFKLRHHAKVIGDFVLYAY